MKERGIWDIFVPPETAQLAPWLNKEEQKMNGFIKWFDSKSKLKRWMLLILIGIALIQTY